MISLNIIFEGKNYTQHEKISTTNMHTVGKVSKRNFSKEVISRNTVIPILVGISCLFIDQWR